MDENVRKELIEKGRIRRQDFSWDKAAEMWWRVCSEELGIKNDCRDVSYDTIKNKQYVVDASMK